MLRQTMLTFKLERTDETLTAHGGLALLAEYTHALGLRALVPRYLPGPGSHWGYAPSVFVETVVLLLQAGGRTLEDLRALERQDALLTLLAHAGLPDPDTVGDWLRRMGDPQTGQTGLAGLGEVRDAGCAQHPPGTRTGEGGAGGEHLPHLHPPLRRVAVNEQLCDRRPVPAVEEATALAALKKNCAGGSPDISSPDSGCFPGCRACSHPPFRCGRSADYTPVMCMSCRPPALGGKRYWPWKYR